MSAIFTQSYDTKENMMTLWYDQASNNSAGLSLRILVEEKRVTLQENILKEAPHLSKKYSQATERQLEKYSR